MKKLAIGLVTVGVATALVAVAAKNRAPEPLLNQIQVEGTHNSYAQGVDPHLLAMADAIVGPQLAARMSKLTGEAKAASLEYHPNPGSLSQALTYRFPSLPAQLDAGMRSLEIDINNDPGGGRYAHPAGEAALKAKGITNVLPRDTTDMDRPGLKVFHIADFDVRSSCNLFRACLTQLRHWSDTHPNHDPIFILVEAKSDPLPIFPGSTTPLPFDRTAFAEMDQSIYDVIGRDHLVTPDQVRGGYPTLKQAVLAHHWPTISAARGKFVFLLLTALDPAALAAYHEGHPNLEGRAAFLRASPGDSYAAFLLMDNATLRANEIPALVKQGYLVRARSDIETYEARVNDLTRANQAFRSGAQIVSTDFYQAGNGYGTPYVVHLPGGGTVRCNPINAPGDCQLRK